MLFVFQNIVSSIGYFQFTDSLTHEYNESAFRTATTVSALVSGKDVSDFLANQESIKADQDTETVRKYKECVSRINTLCNTQDVNVIYIISVNPDYESFISVINCPNSESGYTPWEIGHVENTKTIEDNAFFDVYKQMYEGKIERGTVVRTENLNGVKPHITSVIPLKDGANVVSLLCVQRTMGELNSVRMRYVRMIVISTICFMVIGTVIATFYIRRQFIKPVKSIADEAARFAAENSAPEKPISCDNIQTNELVELITAINDMERDTLKYIDNLSAVISEKQRMGTELHIASLIQEGSVPSIFPAYPDRKEFDLFASMTPAKEVGGDFYDFFLIDENRLAFVMADVSGKGVPAALFMMVTKILINDRALMGGSPAEILTFVNDRICDNNKAEMFVTVWLGIMDIKTGKVIAANAGHDDPAVCEKNGKFRTVKSKHGLVVGAMKGVKYRDFEIQLGKGDKIFLYTDGVPEATDADQRLFTIDGMLSALNKAADGDPKRVLDSVWKDVNDFVKGAPQFDDITMLCLEYKGADQEKDGGAVKIKLAASAKTLMQTELAVEEIFVNIAHYAYAPDGGYAEIGVKIDDGKAIITFEDAGKAYDPLAASDPDLTLSAEDRKIGGLGVFITKNLMDAVNYRYENGKNILTLEKTL